MQEAIGDTGQDHVGDDLSLRGQQRAIPHFSFREIDRRYGEQAIEEASGIDAANHQDGAMIEENRRGHRSQLGKRARVD